MCDFWYRGIFELPEIQELDYFMRLDDDSHFQCLDRKYDPFEAMHASGAHYGFYKL